MSGSGSGHLAQRFDGFDAAMEFLRARADFESSADRARDAAAALRLERMEVLCGALGDPQRACRAVHVAGSKGKGSVCEMTASALRACGCAVGLYTSPHMTDLRERIRIDGRNITGADFAAAMSAVREAERGLPVDLRPVTHFEALTAAAFVHFRSHAVDVAVIETGLGGRHDATNVVRPDVCALTAIHREHTEVLGPTLADIAGHKAGIIKAHTPVVSVPQCDEVAAVLRREADEVHAPLAFLGAEVPVTITAMSRESTARHRVAIRTSRGEFGPVPCPFPGRHQAMNCALALAVLDRLRDAGVRVPIERAAPGFAATPARGRLELVRRSPRIVADGAHTPESVAAVLDVLAGVYPHESLIVVFGCAADKDAGAMLDLLANAADKIILTRAAGPRAMTLERLGSLLPEEAPANTAPTVAEALRLARSAAQPADLILVIGSFAVAGEARVAAVRE